MANLLCQHKHSPCAVPWASRIASAPWGGDLAHRRGDRQLSFGGICFHFWTMSYSKKHIFRGSPGHAHNRNSSSPALSV